MANRNYCFTAYSKPEPTMDEIQYLVYGEEVCPTTQKIHWQGYVELKKPMRMAGVKKLFKDDTLHLEKRQGTQDQAIDYCKKDGQWVEFGERAKQGKRTDLENIVNECKSIEEVMDNYPTQYCQYRQGLKDIFARKQEKNIPDFRQVDVYVYWGEAGSGKTRAAVEESKGDYFMLNTTGDGKLWFDGYTGQKTLIIDDFYGWIKYGELLKILDGYKYRCSVKGSFVWSEWTSVYVTSNKRPSEWYKDGLTPALSRRIKTIKEYKNTRSITLGPAPQAIPETHTGTHQKEATPPIIDSPPHKKQKTGLSMDMSDFHIDCDFHFVD